MMLRGTAAIDAGVGIHRGRAALVPEKLSDAFKGSGLRIEHNLCTQVAKLVWREDDANALLCVSRYKIRDRSVALRCAVGVHE